MSRVNEARLSIRERAIAHNRLVEQVGPREINAAPDATKFLYSEYGLGIYAEEFFDALHKKASDFNLVYLPNRDLKIIASLVGELNALFCKNPEIVPMGLDICKQKKEILLKMLELCRPGEIQPRLARKIRSVITPFAYLNTISWIASVQIPKKELLEAIESQIDSCIFNHSKAYSGAIDFDPIVVLPSFFKSEVARRMTLDLERNPEDWEEKVLGVEDAYIDRSSEIVLDNASRLNVN